MNKRDKAGYLISGMFLAFALVSLINSIAIDGDELASIGIIFLILIL